MADVKISAITESTTAPADTDVFVTVESMGGTPVTKRKTWNIVKTSAFGQDGVLLNGVITPSVASNNLTVALKTVAGADPSSSDPVYVRIGSTVRSVTAALSVTKAAGTNWFASGSSELATQEIDYFVYIGYNATDGVVIGFARIPSAGLYSDFSATSTNALYCGISTITNAAAGDAYRVIGRFNATLSAGAGYTWSIPATSVVINYPIFQTRRLTWSPTFTGFSSAPTNTVHEYILRYGMANLYIRHGTNGTSNTTAFTMTAPIVAVTLTNGKWQGFGQFVDNNAIGATPADVNISSGASSLTIAASWNGSATSWTDSNGKRLVSGTISYPFA